MHRTTLLLIVTHQNAVVALPSSYIGRSMDKIMPVANVLPILRMPARWAVERQFPHTRQFYLYQTLVILSPHQLCYCQPRAKCTPNLNCQKKQSKSHT